MKIEKLFKKVNGKKGGNIFLFTLSTCGWCTKTKNLLKQLGVEYNYVDVDLASEEDLEEINKGFEHWSPDRSFPTIVFNDKECVIGYQEDKIRKFIENEK